MAGKDASKQFWKYHNEGILKKYKGKLQIGSLDSKKQAEAPPTPPATPPPAGKQEELVEPKSESGTGSVAPTEQAATMLKEPSETLEPFGDLIPFGDPSWYQGVRSSRCF